MRKATLLFLLTSLCACAQQAVRYTGQPGAVPVPVANITGTGCIPTAGPNQILVAGSSTGTCTPAAPTISGTTITASLTGAASLNLLTSNNLSDLASAAAARSNLGGVVVGPGSSTTNDCAAFADTTGKVLKDVACTTGGITQLTGDGTAGPGSGSQALTFATVNSNVGTFGDATHVGQFTVNGKGLITAAVAVAITGGGTGCVPSGTVSQILVDSGSGSCLSRSTTIDSSGNYSSGGTISSGVGSGNAGAVDMTAGTSVAVPANSFGIGAGATMTTSVRLESPNAVPSANNVMLFGAPSSNKATWAWTGISGTGSFAMTTSPTFVTPALGTPASGVGTNLTGTAAGLTSGITNALKSATTTVDVSAATAPSANQVLTAVDSTHATWQAAPGGTSGGTVVSKTVDYTAQSTDSGSVLYFNGTNKTYTLLSTVPTMPWIVSVCNINSTALTIARGTATINGGTSNISLPQFQCTTLESDTATGGNNYVANTPLAVTAPVTLTPSANALTFSLTGAVGQIPNGSTGAFTATPSLGTDNSVAGTLQLANGSSNAHTIWSSGATTTNTVQGPATVPTTGHLLDCTTTSTTCLMHDSGVVTANVVNASAPGAGIAHFAGSTQTVTSSAVSLTADVTGVLPAANIGVVANVVNSGTITVPSGNSVLVICTSTCSVPVPVPVAGYQICAKNIAGGTTVITMSALGSSAMYPKSDDSGYGTAGTGTMVSSAAAGNKVCLIGRDSTHYELGAVNASANWTVN